MRISYLQEFAIIAQTHSFTEAARQCHISQSSLSKHMAAFEGEMGIDLFVRPSNPVRLTKAGQSIAFDAKAILHEWDQAVRRARSIDTSSIQEIRVGYLQSASRWVFADVHKWTKRNGEKYRIRPISLAPSDIASGILDKSIDAGVTIDPTGNLAQSCNHLYLNHERLVLAVNKDNPLGKKDVVSIVDLANETFFRPPIGYWPPISVHLEEVFGRLGSYRNGVFLDDVETVLMSVEFGMGIAMVLDHNRSTYGGRIRFIDVQEELDTDYKVPMGLFWLRESEDSYTKSSQIMYLKKIFKHIKEKHSVD